MCRTAKRKVHWKLSVPNTFKGKKLQSVLHKLNFWVKQIYVHSKKKKIIREGRNFIFFKVHVCGK